MHRSSQFRSIALVKVFSLRASVIILSELENVQRIKIPISCYLLKCVLNCFSRTYLTSIVTRYSVPQNYKGKCIDQSGNYRKPRTTMFSSFVKKKDNGSRQHVELKIISYTVWFCITLVEKKRLTKFGIGLWKFSITLQVELPLLKFSHLAEIHLKRSSLLCWKPCVFWRSWIFCREYSYSESCMNIQLKFARLKKTHERKLPTWKRILKKCIKPCKTYSVHTS
jgi:hypothetical protein